MMIETAQSGDYILDDRHRNGEWEKWPLDVIEHQRAGRMVNARHIPLDGGRPWVIVCIVVKYLGGELVKEGLTREDRATGMKLKY